MREASWKNLWAMKATFRGFDMAYGLRINMWKSKLYGIGTDNHFLQEASQFMECNMDKIPFNFLGVKVDFWKPVVSVIKSKLSSWKGVFLSVGGR